MLLRATSNFILVCSYDSDHQRRKYFNEIALPTMTESYQKQV